MERKNIQALNRYNSIASNSMLGQSLEETVNETSVLPHTVSIGIQTDLLGAEFDEIVSSLKQKIIILQQKVRRRNTKISNVKDLLQTLREKCLIEQEAEVYK